MKKLILGAALAVSSLSFAQQFGVKGGVNISSMDGDTWSDAKSKVGFYAGFLYNAPLGANFSIQPELIYTQYGAKLLDNAIQKTNLNIGYVAVPVMFQYNFVPNFYVEAGPEFGFNVNANAKTDYKNDNIKASARTEIDTDNFKTFNFGMGIGLGYDFTENVGINARYTAGLTNVYENDKLDAKNGAFQVGLNYKF